MLDVELAALAGWASVGVIPSDAVDRIRAEAKAPTPARVAELERETNHDVAAFVDAVAETLGEDGRWFHFGLTSSDVLDTALSLMLQEAGAGILAGIDRAFEVVVARAEEHRETLCMGRTHGVHAEPTTFGLKLAGWAFALDRDRERVTRAIDGVRVGMLSGAVGQYAAIDPEVERIACERVGLEPAPSSTQILQRDRHAEVLSTLALAASSLDRFATEIRHLARTEVGEDVVMFLLMAVAAEVAEVMNLLAGRIVDLRPADIGRALRPMHAWHDAAPCGRRRPGRAPTRRAPTAGAG